jgi:hypothetical protein
VYLRDAEAGAAGFSAAWAEWIGGEEPPGVLVLQVRGGRGCVVLSCLVMCFVHFRPSPGVSAVYAAAGAAGTAASARRLPVRRMGPPPRPRNPRPAARSQGSGPVRGVPVVLQMTAAALPADDGGGDAAAADGDGDVGGGDDDGDDGGAAAAAAADDEDGGDGAAAAADDADGDGDAAMADAAADADGDGDGADSDAAEAC